MGNVRLWLLTATLVLLTGCAQPIQRQALSRDRAETIKTVIIAQRPNQDGILVEFFRPPGLDFGTFGGLIDGVVMGSMGTRLTATINPGEVRLQDRFSAKLQGKLQAAGYTTKIVVLPQIFSTNEELLAKVKAQASGDAVLAIAMFGWYVAAGPSAPFSPHVSASVRAVDTLSGANVYQESFTYGPARQGSEDIVLPVDPRYRFANFDALVADPVNARESWIAGLDLLAERIAADLKR